MKNIKVCNIQNKKKNKISIFKELFENNLKQITYLFCQETTPLVFNHLIITFLYFFIKNKITVVSIIFMRW